MDLTFSFLFFWEKINGRKMMWDHAAELRAIDICGAAAENFIGKRNNSLKCRLYILRS